MKPTIGRIVHYKLSAADAQLINSSRSTRAKREGVVSQHLGNHAEAGQVFPATIVRIFDPEGSIGTANLQVTLDGVDVYWATSRKIGNDDGDWTWPPRVN